MPESTAQLPIHEVADALVAALARSGRVVLSAPTGSGKSTQVPQLLVDRALPEGEVVVLQPRRLAARLLAHRVAAERVGPVGAEVGYQIRFENKVSHETRIRFVTEAILLRQILENPELPGVAALVFDEFHERHLSSDLSLACALRAVRECRPDLKLVVMSATLESAQIEAYLEPCDRIEAGGQTYPVEVAYAGASLGREVAPVWERAARAFRQAVREAEPGDALIFMPGAYEIGRTLDAIAALPEAAGRDLLPLHGELPPAEQDRAVQPGDRPRVIVATNVAETSITIDGVRLVIDGGLARIARYDPRRGINSILIEPISRASAEQRRGRAGRTAPGRCIRLWNEAEQAARSDFEAPEVKRIDLSETLLMLAASGVVEPAKFPWFEPPESAALERASRLLHDLGALRGDGTVTPMGRQMAGFPLHPRYARLMLEADRLGVSEEAALIAAISQGRSLYRASRDARVRQAQLREVEDAADARSDFFVQLRAFDLAQARGFRAGPCGELGIHGAAARQAGQVARQIVQVAARQTGGALGDSRPDPMSREEALCRCLFLAFADQLCLRNDRGTRRCRMVHGRSGELRRESLVEAPLFVAAELEERELRGEVGVLLALATAVEPAWLGIYFPEDLVSDDATRYDPATRRVVLSREVRFRDLLLEEKAGGAPDSNEAARLLASEVCSGALHLKGWDAAVENWIRRVNFVARQCPEAGIEPIDDEARQLLVEQVCEGATSYKEIKDRPVLPIVQQWISPEQRYYLETYAPEEIELPRRKRPVRLRYEADDRVVVAARLQDFYDVPGATLRIANGQVPLLIELLAPNGRPAHLTDDLDGFWEGAYQHVKKELAGRYPKHEWR